MLDLDNLPEGFTREKALEFMRIVEQVKRDQERFERENTETPEETEEINKEIEKLLKEYPGSRVLSDGSLAMYDSQQKIRIRHTRKDLAPKGYSMLVASKCISAQILDFETDDPDYYPRPLYYQTILDKDNILVRMDPRSYKWELDFGISYNNAVRLIKMLNRKNPDKEFFRKFLIFSWGSSLPRFFNFNYEVKTMIDYSENLQLAFKQWHYNTMQGYSRNYGFSVDSRHSEFSRINYHQALEKIKNESPKLFARLEKMAKKY